MREKRNTGLPAIPIPASGQKGELAPTPDTLTIISIAVEHKQPNLQES